MDLGAHSPSYREQSTVFGGRSKKQKEKETLNLTTMTVANHTKNTSSKARRSNSHASTTPTTCLEEATSKLLTKANVETKISDASTILIDDDKQI